MGNGIYIALSGAVAQSEAMDVVANNIANVNTTGFHAERLAFGEALAQAKGRADSHFTNVTKAIQSQQPGERVQTDNPLDLALDGDGYFAVDTKKGTRYTRAGNFSLATDGTLSDVAGNPVRAAGGRHLVIPAGSKTVQVASDGTLSADGAQLGVLELTRFDPKNLTLEGNTLYAPIPGAKPLGGTLPQVMANSLERSNVNSVRGVVDLIKIQRTYDALLTSIDSYREIDQRAAKDIGGPK